jgi:hypothetical protein
LVLVEDAAEPVASEDGEVFELAWFGERLGCRPWRCANQAAVGTMGVIEGLELTKGA